MAAVDEQTRQQNAMANGSRFSSLASLAAAARNDANILAVPMQATIANMTTRIAGISSMATRQCWPTWRTYLRRGRREVDRGRWGRGLRPGGCGAGRDFRRGGNFAADAIDRLVASGRMVADGRSI
ncbi:MAG: hypothetical protein M5R42_02035 [Rhodocyclaceae bacterium]|nr:hypothetical protein [Rhodocyclaceae bacterium]